MSLFLCGFQLTQTHINTCIYICMYICIYLCMVGNVSSLNYFICHKAHSAFIPTSISKLHCTWLPVDGVYMYICRYIHTYIKTCIRIFYSVTAIVQAHLWLVPTLILEKISYCCHNCCMRFFTHPPAKPVLLPF